MRYYAQLALYGTLFIFAISLICGSILGIIDHFKRRGDNQ